MCQLLGVEVYLEQLTAAFAMNMAYANVPVSLGKPYFAKAVLSSTPFTKTLALG